MPNRDATRLQTLVEANDLFHWGIDPTTLEATACTLDQLGLNPVLARSLEAKSARLRAVAQVLGVEPALSRTTVASETAMPQIAVVWINPGDEPPSVSWVVVREERARSGKVSFRMEGSVALEGSTSFLTMVTAPDIATVLEQAKGFADRYRLLCVYLERTQPDDGRQEPCRRWRVTHSPSPFPPLTGRAPNRFVEQS